MRWRAEASERAGQHHARAGELRAHTGRWRDLGVAVLSALAENLGYRQLTCWWRVQGLVQQLARRKAVWGVMTRTGFDVVDGAAETVP